PAVVELEGAEARARISDPSAQSLLLGDGERRLRVDAVLRGEPEDQVTDRVAGGRRADRADVARVVPGRHVPGVDVLRVPATTVEAWLVAAPDSKETERRQVAEWNLATTGDVGGAIDRKTANVVRAWHATDLPVVLGRAIAAVDVDARRPGETRSL